jgi:hypothetical protein
MNQVSFPENYNPLNSQHEKARKSQEAAELFQERGARGRENTNDADGGFRAYRMRLRSGNWVRGSPRPELWRLLRCQWNW